MKKVLVIDGSTLGNDGNTMVLTIKFVEGMCLVDDFDIDVIHLKDYRIKFCKGCFYCWNNTECKCCMDDDMAPLVRKHMEADIYIWSTPLHTFGMSAMMKNYLDRLFPIHLGEMGHRASGGEEHACRFDKYNRKQALICSCGFYSFENNIEALVKQFEIMREDNFSRILCSEGGLLRLNQGDAVVRVKKYLNIVRKAGKEFARDGKVSTETEKQIMMPMIDRDRYITIVNNYWYVDADKNNPEDSKKCAYKLITIMSALMDISPLDGREAVMQYNMKDIDHYIQVHIKGDSFEVVDEKDRFLPYNLEMETTFQKLIELDNNTRPDQNGGRESKDKRQENRGMQAVVLRLKWCLDKNQIRVLKI